MTQIAVFVTLMVGAERFEVYWGQFFDDFDVFVPLLVAQAPRSPKQAIFVRTTTTTTDNCFTPCACARGNKRKSISARLLCPALPINSATRKQRAIRKKLVTRATPLKKQCDKARVAFSLWISRSKSCTVSQLLKLQWLLSNNLQWNFLLL